MSKRKILSALKKKNITPVNAEYYRGQPTPYGYANSWELEFPEDLENLVYELDKDVKFSTFMEFDTLGDVLEWVDKLPTITTFK